MFQNICSRLDCVFFFFFACIIAEIVLVILLNYSKERVFFFRILKSNKEVECLNGHVLYEGKITFAICGSHTGFHEDSSLFEYGTASL